MPQEDAGAADQEAQERLRRVRAVVKTWAVPRAVRAGRIAVPSIAVLYALTLVPGVRGAEPVLLP